MNIAKAKEEIVRAACIYLKKDAAGKYTFPESGQRPILLMGPPGIGKSAIVAQAAEECKIGYVSYALTHHTRQSAVGLPHITKLHSENRTVEATEYTMSEIIAAIYRMIETQGQKEGILFIDEINCVSETLTPVMLQFLQTKVFGTHRVPKGWIIVAAGNPPAYNRHAKELDIVTLDRVRTIEIEPDLSAFLAYARSRYVHSAVLSYLQLHPEHFYAAGSSDGGNIFVTPRGWEDLSMLLSAYEEMGWQADISQINQYLHERKTAETFAAYYYLYRRDDADYQITEILDGELDEAAYEKCMHSAQKAGMEERLTVMGLLTGGINHALREEADARRTYEAADAYTDAIRRSLQNDISLEEFAEKLEEAEMVKTSAAAAETQQGRAAGDDDVKKAASVMRETGIQIRLLHTAYWKDAMDLWNETVEQLQQNWRSAAAKADRRMENAFAFCEEGFANDEDMFWLVTTLSGNIDARMHISRFGNDAFIHWSSLLGL